VTGYCIARDHCGSLTLVDGMAGEAPHGIVGSSEAIQALLARIDKAAAILYINRRTLYNKLQLHGIKKSFRSG
jgi:DNA-binding NtrC family response regulator